MITVIFNYYIKYILCTQNNKHDNYHIMFLIHIYLAHNNTITYSILYLNDKINIVKQLYFFIKKLIIL
jgi:hypothetical protein